MLTYYSFELLTGNMKSPEFLDILDSDPEKAFKHFYLFAKAFLKSSPPPQANSLTREDREEFEHDLILSCVEDNFKKLRKYKILRKSSFSGWFYILARNYCIDVLREKSYRCIPDYHNNTIDHRNPGISQDYVINNNYEFKEAIIKIKELLPRLSEYCQLLLKMSGDEFKPREMVLVLALEKDQNKKVSDDLKECRRKLVNLLYEYGIDMDSYFTD